MRKDEYLARLGALLAGQMPSKEVDGILNYYEEYFREVGPHGEAALIAELGVPEYLAGRILGRSVSGTQEPASHAEPWNVSDLTPAHHYEPPSVGVGICLVCTAVLLFIIAISLLVGLAGSGVICVITGIGLVIGGSFAGGLFSIVSSFAVRLCLGGSGLLTAGIGLLLLVGGVSAFRSIWHAAVELLHRVKGA